VNFSTKVENLEGSTVSWR